MMHRTIMAIEEETNSCGGSSGSGGVGGAISRASKKLKNKKVPQRGLGVAQLERIRLEEQHKKDANFQPPNNNSTMPKCLPIECPTFRPSTTTLNPCSIPLPPPPPPPSRMDLPSKDCVFRPNQSAPVIDGFRPKVLQSKPVNVVGGSEVNWSAVLGPGNDHCPKLWSCEYSPERESQQGNSHHHGVVFGPNVNLPSDLHNPILPPPSVLQRSQQYQQSSCSSSMVNILSGMSSPSSSVLNYQMEPPSNQIYNCCNYLPLWHEEVKMVGMKRPYPFTPEYPPVPAFHCKFAPGYVSLASRSPESASCSNECAASLESENLLKREVPSGSQTLFESKPKKVIRQNRALNGDFLTLAPPTVAMPYQHSLTSLALQRQEILPLESVTCQGVAEEPTACSRLNRSVQQSIRFFPSAKVQIDQEGMNRSNCHVEVGANIDLSLKL